MFWTASILLVDGNLTMTENQRENSKFTKSMTFHVTIDYSHYSIIVHTSNKPLHHITTSI